MIIDLSERKNKLSTQLNERDQKPKVQAEKKGQISEGLRIAEKEKIDNEDIIDKTDKKINSLRIELNEVQERSIQIRERRASSGATIEGLKKRKDDLLERVSSELNLEEKYFRKLKFKWSGRIARYNITRRKFGCKKERKRKIRVSQFTCRRRNK